ncbi:hypothetical protein [Methylopila turkensis]|uniref:Uncharacterized protein n=1 Tax=Methylopila turkensis TaxID=1437816 RepID=A0A9W6JRM5_9HYPH|nr:hypothetical protein [Methylopila turkensis]GLK81089.1 hypothetical protein GCM10008174_28300 [Methylopila turkensis]
MTEQADPDKASPDVEAVFRNGTITAFGITLSFSLGFLAQWASSPGVWRFYDGPPAAAIILGSILQIWALALLLPVEGLARPVYDRSRRLYLAGLILTGCGVFGAVIADLVSALAR